MLRNRYRYSPYRMSIGELVGLRTAASCKCRGVRSGAKGEGIFPAAERSGVRADITCRFSWRPRRICAYTLYDCCFPSSQSGAKIPSCLGQIWLVAGIAMFLLSSSSHHSITPNLPVGVFGAGTMLSTSLVANVGSRSVVYRTFNNLRPQRPDAILAALSNLYIGR